LGDKKKLIVRVNIDSRNVKAVVVEKCKQRKLIDVQKRGYLRQNTMVLVITLKTETVWENMRYEFDNEITECECTVYDRTVM
jgi:hypothetical protein